MRDRYELGPCAAAIHAHALSVWTKVTATRQTIAAMAARNVTLTDHEVAFGKTFDVVADAIDYTDKLVPDCHRHGDRFLGPGVPVIYMYVGAADGCLEDANEDVVTRNFGNRNLLEPQSRLRFRLYDGLHRFLHGVSLSADSADSHRLSEGVSQFNLRKSV